MSPLKFFPWFCSLHLVLSQTEDLSLYIGVPTASVASASIDLPPIDSNSETGIQSYDESYSEEVLSREGGVDNSYSDSEPRTADAVAPEPPLQPSVTMKAFPTIPDLEEYSDINPVNSDRVLPTPTIESTPTPLVRVESPATFASWAGMDADDLDDGDVYAVLRSTGPVTTDGDEIDEDDVTFTRSFLQNAY